MTGIIERVGATDTPKQLTLMLFLLSGQLLLITFLFPEQAGSILSARSLIFAAMLFIGSGLIYLALLPLESSEATLT